MDLAALRELVLFAPRRVRLRLALAAFAFHRLRLHETFGYAKQSDFVREQLGMSKGVWFDLVHAGALLTLPAFRLALRRRQLEFSALVLLGRRFAPDAALEWLPMASQCTIAELGAQLKAPADASDRSDAGEAKLVHLRLRLPAAVADYLHESHELCSALVGAELPQPDALHYLLAEASSEVPPSTQSSHPDPAELRPVHSAQNPNIRQPRGDDPQLRPPSDRQRLAVRLAKRLLALSQQSHALELLADDALREACSHGLHHQLGYLRFSDFAVHELGLSAGSANEKLRRARQRARRHPIEVAREAGIVTQAKASLLHGLARCGVPLSAMQHWIQFAAQHTIRALKRALNWARRAYREDLSRLYKKDYRPPSASEFQTSDKPLAQLAQEFQTPPPGLLQDQPLESTPLRLYHEDHTVLVDLTRSLRQATPKRTPLWWQFLQILTLAREGLSQLASASPKPRRPQREILERDRYSCQFPGCTNRRVEIHHIHFRSQGGDDDPTNLLCLCPQHHHHGVHAQTVRIHGRASATQEELIIEAGRDHNGNPLLRYQGERLVASCL